MSDITDLPKTRAAAIKAGSVRFFSGLPCRAAGHVAARYTLSSACVECQRLATQQSKDAAKLARLQATQQREANAATGA